jgi:hypothetical protein
MDMSVLFLDSEPNRMTFLFKVDLSTLTEDVVCICCLQLQVILYMLKETGHLHQWETSADLFIAVCGRIATKPGFCFGWSMA